MHEIRVTVNKDGTTKTDFSGYQGPTCLDAAEQLRRLLASRFGVQTVETNFTPKPELAQADTQQRTSREAQHEH